MIRDGKIINEEVKTKLKELVDSTLAMATKLSSKNLC
jgi:hypothetical protein